MENNNKARILGMGINAGKRRTHTKQMSFTEFGEDFVGTFKFHHPSIMERMQIGVLKSQMLQGLEGRVDVITDNIAHMSSTLEVVLDEAPEWFVLANIDDYEILDGVYEEYIKWYNSFRKGNTGDNNTEDSK